MNLKASHIPKSGLILAFILMMTILTLPSLASVSNKAVATRPIHASLSEDKMLSGTATFPTNGTTEPAPLANSQTGMDNGFAIGVGYAYSGSGDSDFNFYFYNNGFSSSNGNPEQIVLTATTSQVSYQTSIYIYSNSHVVLDNEAWNIASSPYILFHLQYSVSGIVPWDNKIHSA